MKDKLIEFLKVFPTFNALLSLSIALMMLSFYLEDRLAPKTPIRRWVRGVSSSLARSRRRHFLWWG